MLPSGRGTDGLSKSLTSFNIPHQQSRASQANECPACRDGKGGKPWVDAATNAQWTFWDDADQWLPTWGEGDSRGMTVKSVKMWRSGSCGSAEL